ncbi:MAG: hypothetical protein JO215_11610, partial [Ktedonobacteraceae bacterium]|nr:hypothetical protein [Ktedonobacteraceae bacterium]
MKHPSRRWFWIPVFVATALVLLTCADSALNSVSVSAWSVTALFVSPHGNDSHPGTLWQPIKTLKHAQDLVRSMNKNMTHDITVYVEGGTYRLSQPLTFDARDSGTNGHNVIYKAFPEQRPVISGGVPVTDWERVDGSKNLWSAPIPEGLKNTRQLYVNGVRAQR